MVPDMALTGWDLVLVFAVIASPLWGGGLAGVGAALFLRRLKIAHGFGLGLGIVLTIGEGRDTIPRRYNLAVPRHP